MTKWNKAARWPRNSAGRGPARPGKSGTCAPRKFLTKARKVEPGAPARIAAKEKAERLESAMVSQAVQANLELSGGRKSGTGVTL